MSKPITASQIAQRISIAIILIGLSVLVGWGIRSRELTTIVPGWVSMKPNTAFCFIMSGCCLYWLTRRDVEDSHIVKRLAALTPILIIGISGMSELEYLFGLNLHIDELLAKDFIQHQVDYFPGRMSPITAFNFLCVGSALLLLLTTRATRLIQALAVCVAFLTLMVTTGTSYGLEPLHLGGHYTAVALHTNIGFTLLCIGILCVSGTGGIMKLLTDAGAAGKVIRILVPTGILVPMAAGWLSALLEHLGLFGPEYAVSIFSISTIVAFIGLVWWCAEFLRRNEERFRSMLDTLPQLAWMAQPDGHIFWYNQRWFEYTGTTPDQMEGWGWQRVHDPVFLPKVMERWKESITTGKSFEMDFPIRAADGHYRWFLTRIIPIKDSGGKILRWLGTNTDITQKQEAEEEIRRLNTSLEIRVQERTEELAGARERLQSVLDAATQVAIIAGDPKGTITVFNAGAEQMLGYKSQEMVGLKTPRMFHLESEIVARGLELTVELGQKIEGGDVLTEKARRGQPEEREWTFVRKDGSRLTVNLIVTAAKDSKGTLIGFLGLAVDITARKRTEAFLHNSEQRLRLALDAAQIGDWELDLTNQTARRSLRHDQIFGYDELLPAWSYQIFLNHIHPDDRAHVDKSFQESLATRSEWYFECRIIRPDQSVRWIWARGRNFGSDTDRTPHMIGMVGDITDRKRSEEALRVSEERFRKAFAFSSIGFAIVDLKGRWQTTNPALVDILGYSEEELLSHTFQDVTHPDDLDRNLEMVKHLLAGDETHSQIEKRYIHKSGRIVWALLNVSLVRHADGTPAHFIAQIQDVTRRHESELVIQSSLEEKEVLLREIHHRVKNNMQVISSLLQLQRSYLNDDMDVKIFENCQMRIRAMALVHERLYRSSSLASINFAEYLDDLSGLIFQGQGKVKTPVKLLKECDSVDLEIDTAIPLGLIANEIISNAFKHAFRGRTTGTITLSLKIQDSGIHFAVLDDGIGFPDEMGTKKSKSLGMRLIESLSRQIRAKLAFNNQAGGGSRVELVLPKTTDLN